MILKVSPVVKIPKIPASISRSNNMYTSINNTTKNDNTFNAILLQEQKKLV